MLMRPETRGRVEEAMIYAMCDLSDRNVVLISWLVHGSELCRQRLLSALQQ